MPVAGVSDGKLGNIRSLTDGCLPLICIDAVGASVSGDFRAGGAVLLAARLSRPRPPCQGRAARGRFASLDTAATARGIAAIEEEGGGPGRAISAGRTAARRAISGPLTPVTSGLSRSLADTSHRRSGRTTARMAQIPKLTVRVLISPACTCGGDGCG